MPTISDPLLLDTHVWIWVLNDEPRARRAKVLSLIESAALENRLMISVMSIWEIGMLEAHERLILPVPLKEWVDQALTAPGSHMVAVDPDILIESTRLPGGFKSDPMDHILVATARHLNARLVTADRRILDYAKKEYVKVLAFN